MTAYDRLQRAQSRNTQQLREHQYLELAPAVKPLDIAMCVVPLYKALTRSKLHNEQPCASPSLIAAEPTLGVLRRLDTGPQWTRSLGYISRGGTLDVAGMLFANQCTWAHVAAETADALGIGMAGIPDAHELAAIRGQGNSDAVASTGCY